MEMQDKDFDELFRSKLDDLEIEPSANVWAGISGEINADKRKKKLLPLLRIAASVIILIGAGILFIPKKDRVNPLPHTKNSLAHNKVNAPGIKPQDVPAHAPVIKGTNPQSSTTVISVAVVHQPKKEMTGIKPNVQIARDMDKPITVKPDQPVLAAVTAKPDDVIKPVVPDDSTPLVSKQTIAVELSGAGSKPVLASVQPITNIAEPGVKKHRIHSFGDLVNLVVDKVDKRKDKVIVFTDTDDDESTVTALNVGPIKINKK